MAQTARKIILVIQISEEYSHLFEQAKNVCEGQTIQLTDHANNTVYPLGFFKADIVTKNSNEIIISATK